MRSLTGYEVIATELYGNPALPHDEVLDLFTARSRRCHRVCEGRLLGSVRERLGACGRLRHLPVFHVDSGTIATGAMANLIHRAASVALKEERRLVLVPRETPLSTIHLDNMLRLRQGGAMILFAAPGFYHCPESIDDLVDFIVARCLDHLGVEHDLVARWGQET